MKSNLENWLSYFDKEELDMVMNYFFDNYNYPGNDLCPSLSDIMEPFKHCPVYELKVVIIGDEPSTEKGMATGLSFASPAHRPMNESLKMFDRSIKSYWNPPKDLQGGLLDKTLIHWASQGILLLNSALTSEIENPGQHIDIWNHVMKLFINKLSNYTIGIAFVLLGDEAKKFEEVINTQRKHLILKDDLPKDYIKRNMDRKYSFFQAIDLFLKDKFNEEIEWYEDAWESFVRTNSDGGKNQKLWN